MELLDDCAIQLEEGGDQLGNRIRNFSLSTTISSKVQYLSSVIREEDCPGGCRSGRCSFVVKLKPTQRAAASCRPNQASYFVIRYREPISEFQPNPLEV